MFGIPRRGRWDAQQSGGAMSFVCKKAEFDTVRHGTVPVRWVSASRPHR
jgi:hypothetical protein